MSTFRILILISIFFGKNYASSDEDTLRDLVRKTSSILFLTENNPHCIESSSSSSSEEESQQLPVRQRSQQRIVDTRQRQMSSQGMSQAASNVTERNNIDSNVQVRITEFAFSLMEARMNALERDLRRLEDYIWELQRKHAFLDKVFKSYSGGFDQRILDLETAWEDARNFIKQRCTQINSLNYEKKYDELRDALAKNEQERLRQFELFLNKISDVTADQKRLDDRIGGMDKKIDSMSEKIDRLLHQDETTDLVYSRKPSNLQQQLLSAACLSTLSGTQSATARPKTSPSTARPNKQSQS